MKRIVLFAVALLAACTSPSYEVDSRPLPSAQDEAIIDYIDERLEREYYWLDEVAEKRGLFNRRLAWDEYLGNSLLKLTTNADDGHIDKRGNRVFYSYIREAESTTRAAVSGYGIQLYYTIVGINKDSGYYGFIVDDVYDNSPAAEAGIERGDLITMINGGYITQSNYLNLFNSLQQSSAASLELTVYRQTTKETTEHSLTKGSYEECPVAYSEIIEVEGYDKKIGYIVYTGFESKYDAELLAALQSLAEGGATEVILDLRTNGGGAVSSAIKLASSLLGPNYADTIFCSLCRNPKNSATSELNTICKLTDTGVSLGIDHLTVIGSSYSASASEIIIMGLRGLDIPVTLVGTTTEGKNCGMDVTRRTIGSKVVEYAPITFMCFNAKGFGEWGEGIEPDVDISKDNEVGVKDEYFPMPRAAWGDRTHDIGLAVALATVTGQKLSTTTAATTRSADDGIVPTISLTRPIGGTLLYKE